MFGVIVFSNYVLTPAIIHVFMRDEKEEARSNKQDKATAHPRQPLFLRKMSCLRWDSNP